MKKETLIKKLLEDLKPFIEDQIEQDDDLVILEALKTCDYDNELLQDVIQSAGGLASVINDHLEDLTIEDIVRIMENHTKFIRRDDSYPRKDNSLYPSQWPSESLGAYPAKLAQALVKTGDSESLTDIFNIFYADKDLSKEAVDVFMKDVLDDPKKVTQNMINEYQRYDEDYIPDMLNEIAQTYPQFVEQVKQRFHI